MADLTEECLGLLNGGRFDITDAGPLHSPITGFKIVRDDKLRLVLETKVPPDATSTAVDHPPGTVRMTTERVLLRSLGGLDAELQGVVPYRLSTRGDGLVDRSQAELAQVNIASTTFPGGQPARYTIDWLENLPASPFVWPAASRVETDTTTTMAIGLAEGITITREGGRTSIAHNVAKLTVDGVTFYVCALHKDDDDKRIKPGCLVFDGTPDANFRKKIRTALSYCLGLYLIDLGSTHYDHAWHVVRTMARSAYSLGRRAFDMGPDELAPLHDRYLHGLDTARLTRAVTALYRAFDDLDLANLSWAYWHACAATPHIAPAHFGAAIEALQASYLKRHPGSLFDEWVPRAVWKPLRTSLAALIDGAAIPEDAKAGLKAKLAAFNTLDQRTKLKAVMRAVGLRLGQEEDAAWSRRNKAAHGRPIPEGEELAAIRDMKLLKGLFNRLLLAITGAASHYIDYTSPHFEHRVLSEPPPDALTS